ncbi:MAG: CRISPR-associated helicase Cas3', partial [Anaerolineae bacterium]|nr:CRISPR-associated helicase Cas3' [Anaerolineae bacterium]
RYVERAAAQAQRALEELGWSGWQPPTAPALFGELFGFEPRPMQEAVVHLAEQLQEPSLVIIEAPTGEGKTEAALYLADHWARICQQRGLYVAMPTMATSNQMFGRVTEVLAKRYPTDLVNVHLIHSQALWRDDMQALRLDTADERQGGTVAAMAWFLPRKRTLLAPFGVGTVDQAFLGVLQARHFFVRLFGLSHKTVIFDEAHAYDTYMSTIFQRLLGWLRAVGTSVVILSATLPSETRRQLLQAYSGNQHTPLPEPAYPAISWATEGQMGCVPLEASAQRTVGLEWIERDVTDIARLLADELSEGGNAAVVCNTVRRAQEIYGALKAADIVADEELILFHARYPFAWRADIEEQVLRRFGKNGERPRRAIVVATQVIEQSLDLDFDLMISDMAPVDLLLQRAGRLHRHERGARPDRLSVPRLLVAVPEEKDGVPRWGADGLIYEPYVLLRTHLALQGRKQVRLPAETEALIEAVYGSEQADPDLTPALAEALAQARSRMARSQKREQDQARGRLIAQADNPRLMHISEALLEEDRPELHQTLQALTRLIPPGVSLVCLHQTPRGLTLEPDGSGPVIDLKQEPDPDLTKELAQRTVGVTYPSTVMQHFLEAQVPVGWQEHPLLRNYRVAVFQDGYCALHDVAYTLRLCRELGLEIHKEV